MTHDKPEPHDPSWGDWYEEGSDPVMWRRDCAAPGCEWRQQTSSDPTDPTKLSAFDHAMNRLAGIE